MTNDVLIALRGCLQSLTGLPCRIYSISEKHEGNALQLEPIKTITPKFKKEVFLPAYYSWLKNDSDNSSVIIPKFIRIKDEYLEVKIQGEEIGDMFKVEFQESYSLLKGRVALVTGAAQGFGYEIAIRLAASGTIVFLDDINSEGVDQLSKELNEHYGVGTSYPIYADVTIEDEVVKMFDKIIKTVGGIDLIVSNVGVLKAHSILEQPLDEFEFVTKHNYTAFMSITKHSANIMKKQWEQSPNSFFDIIQVNSKSGLIGSNKNGAYAGSKFGSIGLVQSFAMELSAYNIKVNAVCPGNFLDGPLWSDPTNGLFAQYLKINKVPGAKTIADVRKDYENKVPLGKRGCEGIDVFKAIRYLVDQCYETGQALPVSGGQLMLN